MLLLGSRLKGTPIMGLQTGTKLAVTKDPIINPSDLKIIAYEVNGPMLSERPAFIRIDDVRELSDIGMIIDSNDEFIGINDVINIKNIYELEFNLVGINVVDEAKHKLGKVIDYSLETEGFVIQQLKIKPGIMKSLSETELIVHRSQIVEINNNTIVVKSTAKKLAPITKTTKNLTYNNPFRSTSPQTENSKI